MRAGCLMRKLGDKDIRGGGVDDSTSDEQQVAWFILRHLLLETRTAAHYLTRPHSSVDSFEESPVQLNCKQEASVRRNNGVIYILLKVCVLFLTPSRRPPGRITKKVYERFLPSPYPHSIQNHPIPHYVHPPIDLLPVRAYESPILGT